MVLTCKDDSWLLCGTAKAGVCTNAHGSLFLILGDGSRGESGLYGKKRETGGGCSGAPLGGAYPPIHGRGARGRYIHNRPVGCGRRRTKNRGGPSLALDRDPKGRSLDAATAPPRHRQHGVGPAVQTRGKAHAGTKKNSVIAFPQGLSFLAGRIGIKERIRAAAGQ